MEQVWCPLSRLPCREDCAWINAIISLEDDGVSRDTYCAITMIAAKLPLSHIDEDGWKND